MNRIYRFAPPLIIMGAIFYASSRTGDELGTLLPFFQTLFPQMEGFDWGHFVAYFVLGVTVLWAVSGSRPGWKAMVLTVILCVLYGMTDEFHQIYVPGRMSDWHDLRNDGIGAAIAMLALRIPALARLYARLPHHLKHSG